MAPAPAVGGLPLRLLQGLRRRFRSGETGFIALALLVGIGAGLTTWLQAALAHGLQGWLFGLSDDARLSASLKIGFPALLALPVGANGVAERSKQRWMRRVLCSRSSPSIHRVASSRSMPWSAAAFLLIFNSAGLR